MKQFGSFRLDTRNQCLWRHGEQLALAPKPYAVLRYLVENPGRLITHDELLDALWPETYVQPQVLRTYMLELRKILGDDAVHPTFIQTLPKRGYRFLATVAECAAADSRTGSDFRSGPIPDRGPGRAPEAQPAQSETRSQPAGPQLPQPSHTSAAHHPQPLQFPESDSAIIAGRDAELSQLRALAAQIAGQVAGQGTGSPAGHRHAVFVTGEVGIGKTALVDAFARWAAHTPLSAQPALVARGQCVEGFAAKEEYYPVMEALSQLCASPEGEGACQVLASMAPAWLASMGRESAFSAQAVPRNAPLAAAHERMPGDICAALEEMCASRPLVLIFEDLHWADASTLHLISALARRRAPAQLMIVATLRPHGAANAAAELQLKGLIQDLQMRRLCSEICLTPLNRTAVERLLIRELKQDALPSGLAAFVHRRSEGNPLFTIAIVEHLIAQGFLARAASGQTSLWQRHAPFEEMEAGVPDGLAKMIELEVEHLTPVQQSLLEAGSLMHVAFPAWAVAAALQQNPAETEEACDALARSLYFLERAGQDELPDGSRSSFYVFAHGLYREVLYRRQANSRRAQRHIRIAERLGELFEGREADVAREMAMHFEAAGRLALAVDRLRRASELALERQAWAEASDLLERALRIAENLAESEHSPAAQAKAKAVVEDIRFALKSGLAAGAEKSR